MAVLWLRAFHDWDTGRAQLESGYCQDESADIFLEAIDRLDIPSV